MKIKLIREGAWIALNLVAASIFLWMSSKTWIGRAGFGASSGDPATFGALMVKVLGPVFLFNIAWLALAAWICLPRKDWTPTWTFAGLGMMWLALVSFSGSSVGN